MAVTRPTFSESWHRVANVRARLRPSAEVHRQFYRGERWYVVRDPAGNQYHRLSDAAYRFVGLLDGTRNVQEAWEHAGGALADDAPTQPEVIQIMSQLYAANLLDADISPDATVLLRRHKQQLKKRMQGRLMNVLFPRIPLWDPDKFLKRWLPAVGWVFGAFGWLIWFAVIISAVVMLAPRWDDLVSAGASTITDPASWPLLWLTFAFTKLIHELGHGFSCRRFGGEVHEMGIMFLVFIPTPYVDASSAWQFSNKWKRIFVGAAGMYVELFTASIAAFVWLNTTPSYAPWGIPVNAIAYNAMLIASVSTILFNANPLLRYDGYYILSDWLEIPNLSQKSKEYTLGLIKRHIYRIKLPQPLPPFGQRIWMFIYNILSSVYRIFIGILIIVTAAFAVPILGMLMAIGGVITWVFVPLFKVTKYHLLDPEMHRKRMRGLAFCTVVAASVVFLIGIMPYPMGVYAEGEVQAIDKQTVRNIEAGFVDTIHVTDGQFVKKGDVLITLDDPDVDLQVTKLTLQVERIKAQLDLAAQEDQNRRRGFEKLLQLYGKQLADAKRKQAGLVVKAEITGYVVGPELQYLEGRYVPKGQELATIINTEQLQIKAFVEQQEAELMQTADPQAEVRLSGHLSTGMVAMRKRINPVMNRDIPASMQFAGGGKHAPDPSDPEGKTTAENTLQAVYDLQGTKINGKPIVVGQRAYIRVGLEDRPLIWQWMRRFWQLVRNRDTGQWI